MVSTGILQVHDNFRKVKLLKPRTGFIDALHLNILQMTVEV